MDSVARCLHCDDVELDPLPSPQGIALLLCPACGRQFARTSDEDLRERWLGPLSIVLYPVIFAKHPQDRARDVATQLRHRGSTDLATLMTEIRFEIDRPTQRVRDILPGMAASEADLREFLAEVADDLSRG
jgi:hypothetical protein